MSFSPFPFYALGITLVFPAWPLTLIAAASIAWGVAGLRGNRNSSRPVPTAPLALLLLPPLLILVVSSIWFTQSLDFVYNGPARAAIFTSFGAEFLIPIYVVRHFRERRGTALCFVAPALYVTTVAAFLGLMAVGGGASL